MRRGLFAAMLTAVFMAAGIPADAQVRIKPAQTIKLQPNVKVQKIAPKINKAPSVVKVPIVPIKPTVAIRIATQMVPNAKPVGIKLNNNIYVVTLRKNNVVTRVRVNAQTGAAN